MCSTCYLSINYVILGLINFSVLEEPVAEDSNGTDIMSPTRPDSVNSVSSPQPARPPSAASTASSLTTNTSGISGRKRRRTTDDIDHEIEKLRQEMRKERTEDMKAFADIIRESNTTLISGFTQMMNQLFPQPHQSQQLQQQPSMNTPSTYQGHFMPGAPVFGQTNLPATPHANQNLASNTQFSSYSNQLNSKPYLTIKRNYYKHWPINELPCAR